MKQPTLMEIAFAQRSQDGNAIWIAIKMPDGQQASIAFAGRELAKIFPAIKETVTSDCRNAGAAPAIPIKDIKVSTDWPDDIDGGFVVWLTDVNGFDSHIRLSLDQVRGLAATCEAAATQAASTPKDSQ